MTFSSERVYLCRGSDGRPSGSVLRYSWRGAAFFCDYIGCGRMSGPVSEKPCRTGMYVRSSSSSNRIDRSSGGDHREDSFFPRRHFFNRFKYSRFLFSSSDFSSDAFAGVKKGASDTDNCGVCRAGDHSRFFDQYSLKRSFISLTKRFRGSFPSRLL